MAEVYNQKGPRVFLKIAKIARTRRIMGPFLCWTYQFCKENIEEFLSVLQTIPADEKYLQYLKQQADLYECFPENPKLNRPEELRLLHTNSSTKQLPITTSTSSNQRFQYLFMSLGLLFLTYFFLFEF